jgi:phage terminase large subunit GpA-like protein
MDAFSDPLVSHIVMMSSAQVGKTETILNCLGYVMSKDPGPVLLIQPTVEDAKEFSKDRIDPMLRDSPCLRGIVKEKRSRDSENTMLHKRFAGGHVTLRGANSPSGLSGRPIRYVLADEVSRWEAAAGKEGDPLSLAMKRTTTFWNRKIVMTSTPGVKGACRITAAYEESDQRKFMVPCPKCGGMQALFFQSGFGDVPGKVGGLKWDKDSAGAHLPKTAWYECEHCGARIEETEKDGMLARGKWTPTAEFNGRAGFHINELYSPWVRWGKLAEDFLEVKHSRNRERMQVWVNTVLGEPYYDPSDTTNEGELMNRRERWESLPLGVLCLTAGVDVQDNRLEYLVWGWGEGEEGWLVEYGQIMGDTQYCHMGAWKELDLVLGKRWKHARGFEMGVAAAAIDSGYRSAEVYKFCKARIGRRIYATKGIPGPGKGVARLSGDRKKGSILFLVGVDDVKNDLHARLKLASPGPGYMHFPVSGMVDKEFFEQLTSEHRKLKYNKANFPTYVWEKKSQWRRNEALDMTVYAMAAVFIIKPNWGAIKEHNEHLVPVEAPALPPAPKKLPVPTPPRHRSFATRWK